MFIVWIVIAAVLLVAVGGMWAFNSLVRRRNRTAEAWSQIDVELKRRHDLVPNLVQTVKGYAAHEKGTFETVTQARAAAARDSPHVPPRRSTDAAALSATCAPSVSVEASDRS